MRRDFTIQKRVILGVVILLVLADITLAAYSWHLAAAPHAPQQQFAQQNLQFKLLQSDIDQAEKIRKDTPNIKKDCDNFERSLSPASTGYSAVSSELGALAVKSAIQLEDLSFKPTEIPSRGMTEVVIDATVTGNYKNVVGFLNGLQRSPNLYAVDTLALATDSANQLGANAIKVALHLKTYFQTAA